MLQCRSVARRIPCNSTPGQSDLPSRRLDSGIPEKAPNSQMIDPAKATKGRRMSKKPHKKSSKTSRDGTSGARAAAAKTKAAKAGRTSVRKSTGKAIAGTSHKAASKRLKPAAGARPRKPSISATPGKPQALVEGQLAPAFRLPRDGGTTVSLADFVGKKLVLFFYPRADTPGCTREAIDFTRLSGPFREAGTEVLGISADPLRTQEAFRDKHKLSVPLISDEKHETLAAYGAWGEKSMYGRTFLGILRTTVLIGADRRIARIWHHVKVDGHADAVLEAAQSI